MHIALSSLCSPRTRPNLAQLLIEHCPSPLVGANAGEGQGPAAVVLGDSDDTAICKVAGERASALGTADSLGGSTMIYKPAFGSVVTFIAQGRHAEGSRSAYHWALSAEP